jgi:hypothetical protein
VVCTAPPTHPRHLPTGTPTPHPLSPSAPGASHGRHCRDCDPTSRQHCKVGATAAVAERQPPGGATGPMWEGAPILLPPPPTSQGPPPPPRVLCALARHHRYSSPSCTAVAAEAFDWGAENAAHLQSAHLPPFKVIIGADVLVSAQVGYGHRPCPPCPPQSRWPGRTQPPLRSPGRRIRSGCLARF